MKPKPTLIPDIYLESAERCDIARFNDFCGDDSVASIYSCINISRISRNKYHKSYLSEERRAYESLFNTDTKLFDTQDERVIALHLMYWMVKCP